MPQIKLLFPLILIISPFFLWGFAYNLDSILISLFKKSFTLTTVQATLVSAVFIAYFIKKKYGYKSGLFWLERPSH